MNINERISYQGEAERRAEAIRFINAALRRHGDLGTYGDLRGGLEAVIMENGGTAVITDNPDSYGVEISPPYGHGGHDFFFSIDKRTGEMSEADIGTVMPMPPDHGG